MEPTFGPTFLGAFEKIFHDSGEKMGIPTGEL